MKHIALTCSSSLEEIARHAAGTMLGYLLRRVALYSRLHFPLPRVSRLHGCSLSRPPLDPEQAQSCLPPAAVACWTPLLCPALLVCLPAWIPETVLALWYTLVYM